MSQALWPSRFSWFSLFCFFCFFCFLFFCFFIFFLVLLTFDLLYLLLALSQILQNRSASLPVCVLMAVEGDNMRLADAMSATEHLLLRELPTHVHVGRFSGGETYFLCSRRGRPYFLFSGGGGSVCVVFF